MLAKQTISRTTATSPPEPKRAKAKGGASVSPEPNPCWQSLAFHSFGVQPKLAISQPDDPFEREADQVADRVMRMPTQSSAPNFSISSVAPVVAQRKCASCEEEEEQKLQRKQDGKGSDSFSSSPAIVNEALSSGGQPLNQNTRAFMEPRFGRDFSRVRVHTDSNTTDLAGQINARAFTIGNDIGFASGRYEPASAQGQRLLAHELTHVAQQSDGKNLSTIQRDGDRFCPNGDVDDAAVQRHIDAALAFATSEGRTDISLAFSHLRQARESNCCDLNLAAAEHYMYARQEVGTGSWSFFQIMFVIGYSFFKFLHLIPRTGDCPITRASAAQIRWASSGALDGENDYHSTPP